MSWWVVVEVDDGDAATTIADAIRDRVVPRDSTLYVIADLSPAARAVELAVALAEG